MMRQGTLGALIMGLLLGAGPAAAEIIAIPAATVTMIDAGGTVFGTGQEAMFGTDSARTYRVGLDFDARGKLLNRTIRGVALRLGVSHASSDFQAAIGNAVTVQQLYNKTFTTIFAKSALVVQDVTEIGLGTGAVPALKAARLNDGHWVLALRSDREGARSTSIIQTSGAVQPTLLVDVEPSPLSPSEQPLPQQPSNPNPTPAPTPVPVPGPTPAPAPQPAPAPVPVPQAGGDPNVPCGPAERVTIRVRFQPSAGATGYRLYARSADGVYGANFTDLGLPATQPDGALLSDPVNTGFNTAEDHFVVVTAVGPGGESEKSNEQKVAKRVSGPCTVTPTPAPEPTPVPTPAPQPPPPPQGMTVEQLAAETITRLQSVIDWLKSFLPNGGK